MKNNQSLIDLLFNPEKRKHSISTNQNKTIEIDTLTISQEAQELSTVKKSSGRSLNTKIDSSIDLSS